MEDIIDATPAARIAPRAHIAYVGGDNDARLALSMRFQDAGYALLAQEDETPADLGLIDLRGRTVSGQKARSIAGALRKRSPESSLVIIIDPYIDEVARNTLRRHGELVVLLDKPDALIERCGQILRLRNIAEEAGERLKTLASLSRLNEFPPIAAPALPLRILIAGKAGPVALDAINALSNVCEQCVCVFSAGQAMRAIENQRFDGAIFLPMQENDPLMSLARALRRHPKHASLPVIFPLFDPDHAEDYVKRGAADFILTNHVFTDLSTKVKLSARRARLLKSMRRFLQACEGDGVRDPRSGAFTAMFLSEHGARLCARADQTGRNLSIVAIRLRTVAGDLIEPTQHNSSALQQAARLINRVTRAEDTAVRITPDTFLVLAPSTTEANAATAALRIQGVIESSVFRGAADADVYSVNADVVACARPEGLCIEETVAFALTILRDQCSAPDTIKMTVPAPQSILSGD